MPRRKTLVQRIEARIARMKDDAYLTHEFMDLGGERQVLRALRQLTQRGKLLRVGYGVYGEGRLSSIDQQSLLSRGFNVVTRKALDKLGIPWGQTNAQEAYNSGRTTQVPVNPAVKILSTRFKRRFRYANMELRLDRAKPTNLHRRSASL